MNRRIEPDRKKRIITEFQTSLSGMFSLPDYISAIRWLKLNDFFGEIRQVKRLRLSNDRIIPGFILKIDLVKRPVVYPDNVGGVVTFAR